MLRDREFWIEVESKLAAAYQSDGLDRDEAEGIAYHVSEGIRNVPALLQMLDRCEEYSVEDITQAVMNVLVNWKNLTTAYSMLLGKSADFSDPIL